MGAPSKIFLSYARADLKRVKQLYLGLQAAGYRPWMDTENLFGGEDWEEAIFNALDHADFVVICLSPRAIKRDFLQREIRRALYIAKEKFGLEDIFIIPARLAKCNVLEIEQQLSRYQWVNLFEADGWNNLLKAIREGLNRRKRKPKMGNQSP